MNAFFEHHKNSIRLHYGCFDRLLLNGLIQPFQQPERVIGFFNTYRQGRRVTRNELGDIAEQYRNWVTNRSQKWGAPVLEAPDGRRDDFKARSGRRDSSRPGAGSYPGCQRQQEGGSLASANYAALGHSLQFLRERCPLGAHVRPHVSVLPILGLDQGLRRAIGSEYQFRIGLVVLISHVWRQSP